MIKRTKRPKKAVVKVEAAAAEAMQPVPVKVEAPLSRVVLEFVNPAAQQVLVAGSLNEWKPELSPLMAAGDGRWTCNLKLGPGRHEYLFVVDGQWLPDPNARESTENSLRGINSVLTVWSRSRRDG
jgi:1,4-alpha-glucan branching enzyme